MDHCNIAFIGCGNMAKSLIGGLIANGVGVKQLIASDPDAAQRAAITERFGVESHTDNESIVTDVDVIVLAVKPQVMSDVVRNIAGAIDGKSVLIISIAAGIRLASISQWLNQVTAVIRVMPNMPALIQASASALFANQRATEAQKNIAESMMRSVGTVLWLDNEAQMDSVTALSGSGPAYFFYVMEAMEKAGEALGLNKEHARLLTIETAVGAAKMVLLSSSDPAILRRQVTSPGGTTEQALNILKQGKLESLFGEAMAAAKQRAIELSEQFGK